MIISTRTPENEPNHCPDCNSDVRLELSQTTGTALRCDCGHQINVPENAVTLLEQIAVEDIEILLQFVREQQPAKLVLNFAGVEFLSSATLSKLVLLNKQMKAWSGALALCNLCPDVYAVFQLTKLHELFKIVDDEADAMRTVNG